MSKHFTILILLVNLIISCKKDKEESQPSSINPNPTYYTFQGEIGFNDNSTIVSNDNNLLICGNFDNKICLIKITKSGIQQWRKEHDAGYASSGYALVETSNQDVLIVGGTYRNSATSDRDVLLVKTNSDGDTLWTKTYGSIKYDEGYQIIKTNDNNYIISGITYPGQPNLSADIYLIKVNSDGDTLWTKRYEDLDREESSHIMQTQNGEFLITGTNVDNSQPRQLYLLKLDASGNKLWDKRISGNTYRSGYSSLELSNGDLLTCGENIDSVNSKSLLIKTDNLGNVYWEKELDLSNIFEKTCSMKQNNDGTITLTGYTYGYTASEGDIILLKVDQNGNQVWSKTFGGLEADIGINLLKDNNGENILTGTTFSYGQNASVGNIFMTKTDDNGNFE